MYFPVMLNIITKFWVTILTEEKLFTTSTWGFLYTEIQGQQVFYPTPSWSKDAIHCDMPQYMAQYTQWQRRAIWTIAVISIRSLHVLCQMHHYPNSLWVSNQNIWSNMPHNQSPVWQLLNNPITILMLVLLGEEVWATCELQEYFICYHI